MHKHMSQKLTNSKQKVTLEEILQPLTSPFPLIISATAPQSKTSWD